MLEIVASNFPPHHQVSPFSEPIVEIVVVASLPRDALVEWQVLAFTPYCDVTYTRLTSQSNDEAVASCQCAYVAPCTSDHRAVSLVCRAGTQFRLQKHLYTV